MKFRSIASLASGAALIGVALAGMVSPAHAAAMTFKQHDSFDPTGGVFTCPPST